LSPSLLTGVVDVRTLADGGHEFIIRTGCAWDAIEPAPAHAAMRALDEEGWLYCGTLAMRSPVSRATGLALMRAHTGPKYLDLNWREGHVERDIALQAAGLADVLKVNEEELSMLRGWLGGSDDPTQPVGRNASYLLERMPLQMLLVTCGPDGAMAFDGNGHCIARAKNERRVQLVDTVGAGDSFSAVALAGLLRGWDTPTMLARADEFAGHICEVRGAVPAQLSAYGEWTTGWR